MHLTGTRHPLNGLQIKNRYKHIPKLKCVLKSFVDFFSVLQTDINWPLTGLNFVFK